MAKHKVITSATDDNPHVGSTETPNTYNVLSLTRPNSLDKVSRPFVVTFF